MYSECEPCPRKNTCIRNTRLSQGGDGISASIVQATVSDLKAECCRLHKVEEVDVGLFDYWYCIKGTNLEDATIDIDEQSSLDLAIADTKLLNNQDVLLVCKVLCANLHTRIVVASGMKVPCAASVFGGWSAFLSLAA